MNFKSLIPVGRDLRRDFHPLSSLQREVERLFDDFGRGFPAFGAGVRDLVPVMDIVETDKEIEITAELPGLEEKDVQINIADNGLSIRGEKKAEKEEKDKNYRMIERSYGMFSRTLELPAGVNAEAIKASLAKGVLKVVVPKPMPAQAKKIDVKPAP